MLGAGWLIRKTREDMRGFGYRVLPIIMGGVMLFLTAATAGVFSLDLRVPISGCSGRSCSSSQ